MTLDMPILCISSISFGVWICQGCFHGCLILKDNFHTVIKRIQIKYYKKDHESNPYCRVVEMILELAFDNCQV